MPNSLPRNLTAAILGMTLFLAWTAAMPAPAPPAGSVWRDIPRVTAFADVHGAYDELVALLQKAGVVDGQLHWSAGTGHVVSLGDLLDRGADSRQVIELLMRLQVEAVAAGGQLHVVLGNHEAMNLLGDLRYVIPGEYAAYGNDEPAGERDRERTNWVARGQPAVEFDTRFPPGYFGHRALFAPGGRYGQWLLSLPVAIVINDTLFIHGGPSQTIAGLTAPDLNTRYRTALVEHLQTAGVLRSTGLLLPGDAFADWSQLAKERLAASTSVVAADSTRLASAIERFTKADQNPLLESDGPNWYRGAALCNECVERDVAQPLLDGLGVQRVVVGHTVARSARVASRMDGRVIKLDTGMNRAAYKGHPAAVRLDAGQPLAVIYADDANIPQAVPAEGSYVSSTTLPESAVADLLANGNITVTGPRAPGVLDVTVDRDGQRVAGVFVSTTAASPGHELAAWKLDQLLGLGLVPATVEREVQGQRGYLQARPEHWVTQADVQSQGLRGGGLCPLEPQFQLMYTFDALIGNDGRSADRMLYDTDRWSVLSTGHDRAFGKGREWPAYLQARPPQPGAELRRRLGTLDAAKVSSALGAWVSAREQRALLERRDDLLRAPAAAGTLH